MKKLIPHCFMLTAVMISACVQASAQKKSPVLNHIAHYVKDLEKCTAFYRDILQIDTIPEPFHDGRHTWFKIGEHSQLHLIGGAKEVTTHDRNSHLCFSVPSMDAFINGLQKNRISFYSWAGELNKVTNRVDGVKQVYITDPEGYWVEINDDRY
ncbi:VOC family protein [Chitinophaga tropicalis]|nr:VOC family protein [Chitinophaga tropicalis]